MSFAFSAHVATAAAAVAVVAADAASAASVACAAGVLLVLLVPLVLPMLLVHYCYYYDNVATKYGCLRFFSFGNLRFSLNKLSVSRWELKVSPGENLR